MKLDKNTLKPVIVLCAICLVVAAVLGAVNLLTKDVIAENAAKEVAASLEAVLPGGDFEEITDTLGNLPATVSAVHKDKGGKGYVVVLSARSQYTGSEMLGITVAISKEGKIIKSTIVSYSESKDIRKDNYEGRYDGLSASDLETKFESDLKVSGATYSSTAFRDAMADAFRVLTENDLIGQ